MKNHKKKYLKDPISIKEAVSKNYVHTFFNDPSIIKKTEHVDFNDKNLDNVRFVKVNRMPAIVEQLIAKYYVDQAIPNSVDEPTLARNNQNKKCNFNLIIINSITLNTQEVNDNQVITRHMWINFIKKKNDLDKI